MDRRNHEKLKEINARVLGKYKKDLIKKVDVYAEERDMLSRHSDAKVRAHAAKLTETKEEINTEVEQRFDQELDREIRHALKVGILKPEKYEPNKK